MNQSDLKTIAWIVLAIALVALAMWVVRKFDSHRISRFVGWKHGALGKFHWSEGVWSSEVTRAMSPEYAKRYAWLLNHRTQRVLVISSIAVWALCIHGAFDESLSLGFAESAFSWWCVLLIPAYLMLRSSIRIIGDAPDELLDERQIAIRNRAYLYAYRWLALLGFLGFGFIMGVADATNAEDASEGFALGVLLFGFVASSLPSMVLAWTGSVKER